MNSKAILEFNNTLYLFHKTLQNDHMQAQAYLDRAELELLAEYKRLPCNAQYVIEHQILVLPEYIQLLRYQLDLYHGKGFENQQLSDSQGQTGAGRKPSTIHIPACPTLLCPKLLYLLAISAYNSAFRRSETSQFPVLYDADTLQRAQAFLVKAMNCPPIYRIPELCTAQLTSELVISLSATFLSVSDPKTAIELLILNVIAFKALPQKAKVATLQMLRIAAGVAVDKLVKLPIVLNPYKFIQFLHIHDSEFWNFFRPFIQSFIGLDESRSSLRPNASIKLNRSRNNLDLQIEEKTLRKQPSTQNLLPQEQRMYAEYGMDIIIKRAMEEEQFDINHQQPFLPQQIGAEVQDAVQSNMQAQAIRQAKKTFEEIFQLVFERYPSDFFDGNKLFDANKLQIYIATYLDAEFNNTKIEQLHTIVMRQHRHFLGPPDVATQFQHLFKPEKLFTDMILQYVYQRDSRLEKAAELQQLQNDENSIRKSIDITKLQRIAKFANGYCGIFTQRYYQFTIEQRLNCLGRNQNIIQIDTYPTNEFIDYQLRMCRPDKVEFKKELNEKINKNANLQAIADHYKQLELQNKGVKTDNDDTKLSSQLIRSQRQIDNVMYMKDNIINKVQIQQNAQGELGKQSKFDPQVTDFRLYDAISDEILHSITTKTTQHAFTRVYYDKDRLVIPPKFDLNMLDMDPFSPKQKRIQIKSKDLQYDNFEIKQILDNQMPIKGPCKPKDYRVLFKKWEYVNDMGQSLKQIYQARRNLLQKSLVVVHFIDFHKLLRKLRKMVQQQIQLKKTEFADAQRKKKMQYQHFNMYDEIPKSTDCQYYRRLRHQGIILNQD